MRKKFKRGDVVRFKKTIHFGQVLQSFKEGDTNVYVVSLNESFFSIPHNEHINRVVYAEQFLSKLPCGIDSVWSLLAHDDAQRLALEVGKVMSKISPWTGILSGGKFPKVSETRGAK